MNACELALFVSTVACAIHKSCPAKELPLYAAMFHQLGDTLATMIVQDEICSGADETIFFE